MALDDSLAERARRKVVVDLRRQGVPWRTIGLALGVDHGHLHRRYAVDVPRRASSNAASLRAALGRGETCRCGSQPHSLDAHRVWIAQHVGCYAW